MAKKLNSYLYTQGKFGHSYRGILDTENKFLYSKGRYATKITAEDLTDDYIKINSRVLWYMNGYLKTSGIIDMQYKWTKTNHFFKDDYLFLSYKEPLAAEINKWGFVDYANYDICMCGNSIPHIILAAEKYSNFDTSNVKNQIEEKRVWLRDNHMEAYKMAMGMEEDVDLFTAWNKLGRL